MTDFREQLILTLLDKGVLALIALLLGYFVSRKMEIFKGNQERILSLERDKAALNGELEKLRQSRELEFKEKQLSAFYWPVYFRLVKDNAIWKIIPQLSDAKHTIADHLGREVELNYLIKNHEEIVSMIEANIYLAGADEEMLNMIAAYIRHVAVYKTLRETGTYDLNPIDVGEPLPRGFIPLIEARLKQLQAEFDELARPRI